ncbi:hypothetical protein KP509_12G074900 [Ceratopteris richardii]|uniref:CFA20 domain-containing protein n=1 Tax=Ceratopteris richardii TaxID=49495 RepID=A0A8T2TN38_CERRI|nr:hypothetical protein KP509_12G074900 [Ceratopteris richardii]
MFKNAFQSGFLSVLYSVGSKPLQIWDKQVVIVMQTMTRVRPFICCMPMRLDEGWNQIQFNLSDFTRRAYGTNYVETLRVQVHANCRIRRIYFSDRLYSEEEVPPEFKLFLPIQDTRTMEAAYMQEPPPPPINAVGA